MKLFSILKYASKDLSRCEGKVEIPHQNLLSIYPWNVFETFLKRIEKEFHFWSKKIWPEIFFAFWFWFNLSWSFSQRCNWFKIWISSDWFQLWHLSYKRNFQCIGMTSFGDSYDRSFGANDVLLNWFHRNSRNSKINEFFMLLLLLLLLLLL